MLVSFPYPKWWLFLVKQNTKYLLSLKWKNYKTMEKKLQVTPGNLEKNIHFFTKHFHKIYFL